MYRLGHVKVSVTREKKKKAATSLFLYKTQQKVVVGAGGEDEGMTSMVMRGRAPREQTTTSHEREGAACREMVAEQEGGS